MSFSDFSAWDDLLPPDPDAGRRPDLPRRVLQMTDRLFDVAGGLPSAREISELARAVADLPPSPIARSLGSILHAIADSHTAVASALLGFGDVLEADGVYRHAGILYEHTANIGTRVHSPVFRVNALHRLGRCRRHENRPLSARDVDREALAIAQWLRDDEMVLFIKISMANLAAYREQYSEACRLHDEVITEALAARCYVPLAFALHDRGALAIRDGEYSLAFDCLDGARRFDIDPEHKRRIEHDLGHLARERGDYDAASDAFSHVRESATQTEVIGSVHISQVALAADMDNWGEWERLVAARPSIQLTDRLECDYQDTIGYSLVKQGRIVEAANVYRGLERMAKFGGFFTRSEHAGRAARGDFTQV